MSNYKQITDCYIILYAKICLHTEYVYWRKDSINMSSKILKILYYTWCKNYNSAVRNKTI